MIDHKWFTILRFVVYHGLSWSNVVYCGLSWFILIPVSNMSRRIQWSDGTGMGLCKIDWS